ncbi:MAG: acetyl-CoA C-acyltransferase [Haliea sp.]|nr:acetyl-CoA C-acyltransferase [Haliea sp.]
MKEAFIYDAIRSPRTKAKDSGGLHDLTPQELLKQLYEHLRQRTDLNPDLIGEIILGCVTQHGEQAGNIAKTSALYAGLPSHIGGMTVSRFCSSGIDAISLAALKIGAGHEQAVIAGGVEMMSRVPMLSDKARAFIDPAFAAQCQMLMMGSGADLIASLYDVSRGQADAIALQSQQRAARARDEGYFASIVPLQNPDKNLTVTRDECIRGDMTIEQLAGLPAAFAELGTKGVDQAQLAGHPQLEAISHIHTAGNSPAMCDGAAVLLIGDAALANTLGRKPRGRILGAATASTDPLQVLTGCVSATERLLQEQGIGADQVDLFELHEAFAATTIKAQRDLGISEDKLNVNGGVIALGHPMGATGAMMAGTLLDELERRELRTGVVAASGAAGSGSALLIETV